MSVGPKIIAGLQDAVARNFARVTVDGVSWVRQEQLGAEREEAILVQSKLADEIDRLRADLETLQKTNADLRAENEEVLERLRSP